MGWRVQGSEWVSIAVLDSRCCAISALCVARSQTSAVPPAVFNHACIPPAVRHWCRVRRRSKVGRYQLEQTAKLMMEVMRLNSKLVKGLKECRARGGPPRIRRLVFLRVCRRSVCRLYFLASCLLCVVLSLNLPACLLLSLRALLVP